MAPRHRSRGPAVGLLAAQRAAGRGRPLAGPDRGPVPRDGPGAPWALGARGHLAALQGDQHDALADITETIRLAVAAGRGAEPAAARGYLYLNLALTFAGRTAEALEAAETARQRLTACGHRSGLLSLEIQLGLLHHLAGDPETALACCERGQALLADAGIASRARTQRTGPAPGRVRCLSGYLQLISGLALIARPETERAGADALRRGLTAKHELGDVLGTAYALEALAWLAARRGQYERAAWLLGAAEQLWARTGQRLSGIALMEDWRERADQRDPPGARPAPLRHRLRCTAPGSAWTRSSGTPPTRPPSPAPPPATPP